MSEHRAGRHVIAGAIGASFVAAALLLPPPVRAADRQGAQDDAGSPALGHEAAATPQQGDRVVIGKVIDHRDVRLKGVPGDGHRMVKIQNRDGKQMVIDLGSSGEQPRGLDLQNGDRVIAIGRNARVDDRPVLYARYVGELHGVGNVGASAKGSAGGTDDGGTRGGPRGGPGPTGAATQAPTRTGPAAADVSGESLAR